MCGIAGIFDLGARPEAERVRAMNAAQAHRGPDGEGLLELGPVVLGHRRLAIIDLSPGGAQPMRLPEADLALTYNGELYNYVELREELIAAGERFTSTSDTEVVLRAYARWGEAAFERFNGMWALAIWDGRAERLVLSRDRFGIKPLYLFQDGTRLVFASEIKAVLVGAPAARGVDLGVLGRFLRFGVQDDGQRTFFAGVRQLAPGSVVRFQAEGAALRRHDRRCWSFSAEAARATYDYRDPAATLRALLEDSVALRLRSDVPVGTCLSGGLDSSTVVALASRRSKTPVRTFTAVHADRGYDERGFARAVVEAFGCEAAEIEPRIDPTALVDLLDLIGWYHDEPCARPGLITQWYVMSLAAGRVKVLLDGQGGDELLLGYASYAVPYLRTLWRSALQSGGYQERLKFWRDTHGLLGQPSTSPEGPGTLFGHLARAAAQRLTPRRHRLRFSDELMHASDAVPLARTPADGRTPIDRLMQDEVAHLSIPALLHHEDRTSMAFSIEARVPFLDHRVVEFALGLDFREKVEGGLMKSVLRRAVADVLPPAVVNRVDKLGYPTPLGRWLLEAGDAVKEALFFGFSERGYLPLADLERTWTGLEEGRGDPWLLYRCLTTELWLRRFIDQPPAPPLLEPRLLTQLPLPTAPLSAEG